MRLRATLRIGIAALALVAATAPAGAQSAAGGDVPAAPITPLVPPPPAAGAAAPLAPPAAVAPGAVVVAPPRAKPARTPLAKRWWFWAGLGAAAVGVVLAAIFLGPRDPYNGNASPGTVTIF